MKYVLATMLLAFALSPITGAVAQTSSDSLVLPNIDLDEIDTRDKLLIELAQRLPSREDLYALEDEIIAAFEKSGSGTFDGAGAALDGTNATLFMYGKSSDAMFADIEPILRKFEFANGATIIRTRRKDDGSKQTLKAKIEW